mmetsp:Transcript_10773/g.23766  ORF Transcript_10773/g.23766 Transcript_10773/m.23766 type:complete len:321 (-) Transcript_10773:1673-2635(-)
MILQFCCHFFAGEGAEEGWPHDLLMYKSLEVCCFVWGVGHAVVPLQQAVQFDERDVQRQDHLHRVPLQSVLQGQEVLLNPRPNLCRGQATNRIQVQTSPRLGPSQHGKMQDQPLKAHRLRGHRRQSPPRQLVVVLTELMRLQALIVAWSAAALVRLHLVKGAQATVSLRWSVVNTTDSSVAAWMSALCALDWAATLTDAVEMTVGTSVPSDPLGAHCFEDRLRFIPCHSWQEETLHLRWAGEGLAEIAVLTSPSDTNQPKGQGEQTMNSHRVLAHLWIWSSAGSSIASAAVGPGPRQGTHPAQLRLEAAGGEESKVASLR